MKVVVSENAVRDYISEIMTGSGNEPHFSPVAVSPNVDPSAAMTEPTNNRFKPQNRAELKSAMSVMIDQISDDDSSEFFLAMKDLLQNKKDKEEDKKMDDQKKTTESFIRAAIRKILNEAGKDDTAKKADLPPVKKIPYGMHGSEYLSKLEKRKADVKRSLEKSTLGDGEEHTKGDMPVPGRERKNVMQTDVSGASFKEIAKEMGFSHESGAKAAVERAMQKAKFLAGMDPDDLQILTLTAMNDYIDVLKDTGELTAEDVKLMKDHPQIVVSLDGFREYLSKVFKRAHGEVEK